MALAAAGRSDEFAASILSILRQPLDLEVVVVDDGSAPEPAAVARRLSRSDRRVRVITDRRDGVPGFAGLAAARGRYLVLARPDGLPAHGGYAALVAGLEDSGADLAVGAVGDDPLARALRPDTLDPGLALTPVERPDVALADLAAVVFRRSSLAEAGALDRDCDPGPTGRLLLARAFTAARAVDVGTAVVCYPPQAAAPSLDDWLAESGQVLELLTGADRPDAAERFAEQVLGIVVERSGELVASDPATADRGAAVVNRAVASASTARLARLPARDRWRLALLALAQPALLPQLDGATGAEAASALDALDGPLPEKLRPLLGLGGDTLADGFRRRFLPTPPPPPAAPGTGGTPDISVVIPTHDVEDYLDELLDSVRAAAGPRLEIIVVDDHSSDTTWQILERHARQDARLRLLRSPVRGGGAARNTGVAAATGEWLCFADGDDIVPPDAYAAMLETARRTDAEIVSASYEKFGDTWRWDGGTLFGYDLELDAVEPAQHPRLLTHRVCWNRLIRRDFWLANQLEFPNVPRANDIVPMTRALLAARRISVVPVLSYRYRTRPGSMTAAQGSAVATLSYLTQETEAAGLVATADPAVRAEYWSVILPDDCWRHMRAYLGGMADRTPDEQEMSRLAAALSGLVGLAPTTAWRGLSSVQRAIYALVCAGRPGDAARLLPITDRRGNLGRPTALAAADAVAILAAVADTGRLSPSELAELLATVLVPVLSTQPAIAAPVATAAAALARLAAQAGPLAARPGTPEERVARALRSGDGEALRHAMDCPTPRVAARLHHLPVTRLAGTDDPSGGRPVWLVASRKQDGRWQHHPVGRPEADGPGWRIRLRPDSLPGLGRWRLSLRWEDDWGTRTARLALRGRGRASIPGRLSRITSASPEQATVRVRPALRARVTRWLRPGRGRPGASATA